MFVIFDLMLIKSSFMHIMEEDVNENNLRMIIKMESVTRVE